MAKRNPAEVLLDLPAGKLKAVATGADGTAYPVMVAGKQKYLVIRKGLYHPDKPEEDAVATTEVWTSTLPYARHLADRERYPKPQCTCRKCRTKPTK